MAQINISHHIREKEASDLLKSAGDEGLLAQMSATLKSPLRGWIIYVWVLGTVIFAAMIWSAIAFFNVEGIQNWILCATIFLTCTIWISLMKMWYYIEANQYTHTREIKRLERKIEEMGE